MNEFMGGKNRTDKVVKAAMVVIYCVVLILLCLMTMGCGSVKKVLSRKNIKTERKEATKVSELTKKEVRKTELSEITSSGKKTADQFSFSGEVADKEKPATVTKEEQEGKTVWTFENFDRVETRDKKQETRDERQSSYAKATEDVEIKDKEESSFVEASEDVKIKDLDKEVKNRLPWWIWLIIAGGFIYLVYDTYTRFLPFKKR